MLTDVRHVRLVSRRKNYPFFLYIILTFIATGLPGIVLGQTPANDHACDALEFEGPQDGKIMTTEGATSDWINKDCVDQSARSVWFKFDLEQSNDAANFVFNGLGTVNSFAIGRFPQGCEEDFKLIKRFCNLIDSDEVEIPGLHPDSTYYVVVSSTLDNTIQGSMSYEEKQLGATCTSSDDLCINAFNPYISTYSPFNFELCSYGATPDETNFTGCFDFENTPAVWQSFTTGQFVNFASILLQSSDLPELQMALFAGDCENINPVACNVGFNNEVQMQLVNVFPNTLYHLLIAAKDCQVGDFDLRIQGIGPDGTTCNTNGEIYTTPYAGSDPSGPFKPGETVNVCFNIPWQSDGANQGNGCQWLHGITPEFGDGWDPSSFLPTGQPAIVTGTNIGPIFDWYESGVFYNNLPGGTYPPGTEVPRGWFVSGQPGNSPNCTDFSNPNCTFGASQPCGSVDNLFICFDLITKLYPVCDQSSSSADLTISYKTFGDGETGGWTQAGCSADLPVIRNMALQCCPPLNLIAIPMTQCSGESFNIDLANYLIGNNTGGATFTWQAFYNDNFIFPLIANNDPDCSENCGSVIQDSWINIAGSIQAVRYRVTVTDADICAVSSEDFFVYIQPEIPAQITGPETICIGECAILSTSYGTIFWNGISGNSIEVCPAINTAYHLEIIDPTSGCSQLVEYIVEVYPELEIFLETDSGNTDFCFGELPTEIEATVSQGTGGYAFEWNGPTGLFSAAPNYVAEVSGTYFLTVTDTEGCSASSSITISESPEIIAQITSDSPAEFCYDENLNTVVLTMEIDNPMGGPYDYQWMTSDGIILSGNGSSTIAVEGTGIYTCILTDGLGCTVLDDYFLNIYPEINIDFSIPANVCASPLAQDILAATPTGGSFSGEGVINGEFVGETPGVYTINYFAEDSNGCTAEANFDITVADVVEGFVEHPAALCQSQELYPLVASPPGGVFSNSLIIEGNAIRPIQAGVFNIVYTFGDPNSDCSGEYTFSVEVNENPQVDLELSTNEVCLDEAPVNIFMTNPSGGEFTMGNVNSNNEFIPTTVGENSIEYTFTNSSTGCSSTAVASVLVIAPDPVTISPVPNLCIDEVVQLAAQPAGGTFSGTNTSADGFFAPTSAGNFLITYIYENAVGCISEDQLSIEVSPAPIVAVDHPLEVCQGDIPMDIFTPSISGGIYSGNVNAQGEFIPSELGINIITYTYTDPGTGCSANTTFSIEVLDVIVPQIIDAPTLFCYDPALNYQLIGSPAGGVFGGEASADGIFKPLEIGLFTITYSTENSSPCGAVTSITIEVTDLPLLAVEAPAQACLGDAPIDLIATPSGGVFSNNVNAQGQYIPSEAGVDEISYSYTDGNGCSSIYYFTIEVTTAQEPVINGPSAICFDLPWIVTPLEGIPAGGTWSSNVMSDGTFVPEQIGLSTVTYSVVDQNGCLGMTSLDIQVNALPAVSVNYPETVCLSNVSQTIIEASPAGGIFSGPVDGNGNLLATTIGQQAISYTVVDQVTGCSSTEEFTISVIPDIAVTVNHPQTVCLGNTALDILDGMPAGGTYTGAVNTAGEFEPFTIGENMLTYSYTDPQSGCSGSYNFSIQVIAEEVLNEPLLETLASDVLCVGLVHQFCIYPVPDAQDYIWTSNNAIISYATPNHLCVNVGWNTTGFDQLCVVPIGECGPSPNTLCLDINIVSDPACNITSNIDELEKSEIHIYPNPTQSLLQIASNRSLESVVIYNALGKIVFSKNGLMTTSYNLHLDEQAPGVYFVQVGKNSIEKIIVAR